MKGVEFEEQQHSVTNERRYSFLPTLVIRYSRGKIETETQANLLLLVIAGIIFVLAIFVGFSADSSKNNKNIMSDAEVRAVMEKTMNRQTVPVR